MDASDVNNGLVLLSSLSIGQKALIVSFTFDTQTGEKEKKLGLIPGEVIEVVRRTFLGDPIEIKIRGYFLAIRKKDAEHIKVKVL